MPTGQMMTDKYKMTPRTIGLSLSCLSSVLIGHSSAVIMKPVTVCASLASQAVLGSAAPGCVHRPVSLDGYGVFSGTTVNATYSGQTISPPVDAWLGIDYTTQPAGQGRRFTAPDWPAPFEGVRAADTYGKACIQEISASLPAAIQDEACLNFNVFRTPGVPLSKKLPVLVWIHGGAFFAGSYKSFDGAAFAAASTEPVVVVNFHYRVSSLGFLPSELLDDRGLSNLGIRDQRFFFDFVQRHIGAFGGDPDTVTIGGRSAGGHSVGIHYFHNVTTSRVISYPFELCQELTGVCLASGPTWQPHGMLYMLARQAPALPKQP